jgi:hypothetical protein
MRKFLRHIAFFCLPVLAGVALLYTVNPEKQFTYRFVKGECSNRASWIYDRIFLAEKELDVLFLGASQTAASVDDALIEKRLAESTGRPVSVTNIGYCRGGRDVQYVMLKDVYSRRKPGMVVIEVTEDEPKKSHPVFPYLAEGPDLFGSAVFFNQRYPMALWKGLVIRFEYLKWMIFGNQSEQGNPNADHGFFPSESIAGEPDLSQNRNSWVKRLARRKSSLLRNMETRYSRHYLEKMVSMAEANQSRVVFLYMRESGSGLQEPLLADYYRSVSPVLILPDSLFSNPENWSDAMHLNARGAALASENIAEQLAGHMVLDASD